MAPPTWFEVPPAPAPVPRSRWWRVAIRLLVPLALAAVLWWLGSALAAVLVVVATVVLTGLSIASPSGSARVEHWMARFGHLAGRAIALVLLAIVNVFVFAPVALVMWMFRYDAIAPGMHDDEPSFWRAHTSHSLPRRQFADERALWAPVGAMYVRRRPILRLATVIGVVALVLLADLAGGWVFEVVSNETRGTAAVADDAFHPSSEAAFRDSPWAATALAEQAALPGVTDPFLGYRLGTKTGTYTNIIDGVRSSYQSTVPGKKVSVWFFGASALMGDGQRDEHTIPSEFARLAERDGIALEVRNYGRPGIGTWQALELFEQTVAKGERPDLVVFYDGFNDLAWQMNVELSAEPTSIFDPARGQPTNVGAAGGPDSSISREGPTAEATREVSTASGDGASFDDVVDAYWNQSASHYVYDALSELFGGSAKTKVQFAEGVPQDEAPVVDDDRSLPAARNAISIQSRAAKLATAVAESVGADAAFFWQPSVFTKQLLPEEQRYLTFESYEPERWAPVVKAARRLLARTPYVDLGDALDGATSPVLWDFVHTNEAGARLAAEAIYSELSDMLEARADEARSTR